MKRKLTILFLSTFAGILALGASVAKPALKAGATGQTPSGYTVEEILPTDERLSYTGTWEFPAIASTCTGGNSVSFTGTFTQVDYYGEAGPNMTSAKFYIDGVEQSNFWFVRDESEKNSKEFLATSGRISKGEHTVKIEHSGGQGWISLDKLVITNDEQDVRNDKIDDADQRLSYQGFAHFDVGEKMYQGTVSSSCGAGDSVTYKTFGARQFTIFADISYNRGFANVYIDGKLDRMVNFYDGLWYANISYPVYVSPILSEGTHEIKLEVLGTCCSKATEAWVAFDALEVSYYNTSITNVVSSLKLDSWKGSATRDVGDCTTDFAETKSLVLTLNGDDLNLFKEGTDELLVQARERYESWALALNQNPYGEGSLSNQKGISILNTDNFPLFIVASSAVALVAMTIVLTRKRRFER